MKTKLISTFALAAALAAPTFAFAQSANGPVTRASVRAQLVQLEQAGYNPSANQANYPANIQAAERRVSLQNAAAANSSGSSTSGSSQSGAPAHSSVGQNSAGWSHLYYPDSASDRTHS